MLPDVKGRPLVASQVSGPDAYSATITAARLADRAGMPQVSGPLSVTVVTLPPCARRSWYAASWLCPWCDGFHLSRGRTEAELLGPRRAGCGRHVVLTAAAAR